MWKQDNEAGCAAFTRTVELVGKKWTPGVMLALAQGATRFSEIRRMVPGLTDRLLS